MKQHRPTSPTGSAEPAATQHAAPAGESMAVARERLAAQQAAKPPQEEASFISEFTAGLGGYLRANLIGDTPSDYTFKDPVRARFHEELQSCDIPATLVRQLRNQNYVQDTFGNTLPPEAADAMLDAARRLKVALESGDRSEAAGEHVRYMLDTIEAFTDNGSSAAPSVLHRLGVAWQTPGVAVSPGHLLDEPSSLLERIDRLLGGEPDSSASRLRESCSPPGSDPTG